MPPSRWTVVLPSIRGHPIDLEPMHDAVSARLVDVPQDRNLGSRERKKEEKTISPPIWKPNRPSHAPRCTAEIRARLRGLDSKPCASSARASAQSSSPAARARCNTIIPPRCCFPAKGHSGSCFAGNNRVRRNRACMRPPPRGPRLRQNHHLPAVLGGRSQPDSSQVMTRACLLLSASREEGGGGKDKILWRHPPPPLLVRIGGPEGSRVTLVPPRIHTHGAVRTRTGAWARQGKMESLTAHERTYDARVIDSICSVIYV